jgi:hypothetical protein|tara:strand:- start:3 stop:557 length:555 start_codon:yes stop_codon:yes gene_type:complete
MKKTILINLISFFIINFSIAENIDNYKISIDLDNILLKTRDIKETTNNFTKNNVNYNFVKYNEKNSFAEITLRTLNNNKQYYSLSNKIELISNKHLSYMNNLSPDKLTDIHTFFDQSVDRNFYYRIFDNKKFEKERCIIFVSGTKKNKDNLYTQIVDGVACSTEIKLNHNNIQKILSLIKITKI